MVAEICMERWDQFLEGLEIIIPSKGRSRAKSLGPTQALRKRKWTGAEPRERVIRRDVMGQMGQTPEELVGHSRVS